MEARESIDLPAHFLAALAYRAQKAVRGAPALAADFRVVEIARAPHDLGRHMTGLMECVVVLFLGGVGRPDRLDTFETEIPRFHTEIRETAELCDTVPLSETLTPERLLQGPLAHAMTHVGQLAMLRRCVNDPVPPEKLLLADIDAGNLGPDQPAPRAPKEGWRPDQLPPSPGRPLH